MSGRVWALVLVSAVCHAGWNFYARRISGHIGLLWLAEATALLVLLPLGGWVLWRDGGAVSWSWLGAGCILATGLLHALYLYLLGRTYARGEISVVYPVARGTGVGLTGLAAWVLLGEGVSSWGGLGIGLVLMGIALMSYRGRRGGPRAEGVGMALGVGGVIACYSLVDKMGVGLVQPVVYIGGMYLVTVLAMAPFVARSFGGQLRTLGRAHIDALLVIGLGSSGTYLMILFAFQAGPVGYIVAARESAVIIGALLGVVLLKEPLTPTKGLAIAAIGLGLFCIKAG
ncbi:MAG: EamA family transporter [Candidatus Latescibacteria bacterium]|nr:EamA family transporter [Candidatus Latescibacterota bacterium]